MSWRGGDWMCGACEHQNFKKRDACQRCSYPKYGGVDVSSYLYSNKKEEILAGDWLCSAVTCGSHNYATRIKCYRCGAFKNDSHALLPAWKTGDWICNRIACGVHNYASRMECYKCQTPREYGGAV